MERVNLCDTCQQNFTDCVNSDVTWGEDEGLEGKMADAVLKCSAYREKDEQRIE